MHKTIEDCIAAGDHFVTCDHDGYCTACGEQGNPIMSAAIRASYPDAKCPDCGLEIPEDVIDCESCVNCSHVFVMPQAGDESTEEKLAVAIYAKLASAARLSPADLAVAGAVLLGHDDPNVVALLDTFKLPAAKTTIKFHHPSGENEILISSGVTVVVPATTEHPEMHIGIHLDGIMVFSKMPEDASLTSRFAATFQTLMTQAVRVRR